MWDLKNKQFFNSAVYKRVKVFLIYTSADMRYDPKEWDAIINNAGLFAKELCGHLKGYGLGTEQFNPNVDLIQIDEPVADEPDAKLSFEARRNKWQERLDKAYSNLEDPSLVVVMLPFKDTQIYSDVKWWGDCVQGIPTVCMLWLKVKNWSRDRQKMQRLLGNLR